MLDNVNTILSRRLQIKTKTKTGWTNKGSSDIFNPQVKINWKKVILIPIFKQFMKTEILRSIYQCKCQPKTHIRKERKKRMLMSMYFASSVTKRKIKTIKIMKKAFRTSS